MSDKSAGQEGPTPDFIPGWFAPREGNPDPAMREAVRIPDPGDFFPITFLRSTETVRNPRRPQLGFTIGRVSEPGHELFDLAVPPGYWIVRDADGALHNWRDEDFKAKYTRSDRDWTPPVERDVPSGRPAAAERKRHGAEAESLTRAGRRIDTATEIRREIASVPPEAWKGTPPAEGTRRALIRDAIATRIKGFGPEGEYRDLDELSLELADVAEEALLRVVDQGATPESGSPASVAMDLLDSFEIPRTREGAILTIADRVTALADELVETRRQADIRRASADGLAATVDAQQRAMDKIRAEAKVKPGTKELVIVLEDVSDADQPPEYRFIELEDQDGAGVGGFGIKPSSRTPFLEITIPYGRDDAWVSELAYQVAGAATRPLLEDNGDYVFPAERVSDAVAELLSDFGIPRACRDCAEEQIGHGAKEVDGRRDDTIKSLSLRCDSLLAQREQARGGEDHFKAQRDSALHLVRWLIGDIIPPDLIRFADDEEAR